MWKGLSKRALQCPFIGFHNETFFFREIDFNEGTSRPWNFFSFNQHAKEQLRIFFDDRNLKCITSTLTVYPLDGGLHPFHATLLDAVRLNYKPGLIYTGETLQMGFNWWLMLDSFHYRCGSARKTRTRKVPRLSELPHSNFITKSEL